MKWPEYVMFMRHDTTPYNLLKRQKEVDPLYQRFVLEYDANPESARCKDLALMVWNKYRFDVGDHNTPLVDSEAKLATKVGESLRKIEQLPDLIYISPYDRAHATLNGLIAGWPELAEVKCREEERIREQEHGLAILYSDWRVFFVLHPEQRLLYEMQGPYWYRYSQGENVPDVRMRNRDWISTLIRDYAGKKVLAITHHLNILALRANLERLDAEEFIRLDEEEKPINCGITKYVGVPSEGKNGRLKLDYYNRDFSGR